MGSERQVTAGSRPQRNLSLPRGLRGGTAGAQHCQGRPQARPNPARSWARNPGRRPGSSGRSAPQTLRAPRFLCYNPLGQYSSFADLHGRSTWADALHRPQQILSPSPVGPGSPPPRAAVHAAAATRTCGCRASPQPTRGPAHSVQPLCLPCRSTKAGPGGQRLAQRHSGLAGAERRPLPSRGGGSPRTSGALLRGRKQPGGPGRALQGGRRPSRPVPSGSARAPAEHTRAHRASTSLVCLRLIPGKFPKVASARARSEGSRSGPDAKLGWAARDRGRRDQTRWAAPFLRPTRQGGLSAPGQRAHAAHGAGSRAGAGSARPSGPGPRSRPGSLHFRALRRAPARERTRVGAPHRGARRPGDHAAPGGPRREQRRDHARTCALRAGCLPHRARARTPHGSEHAALRPRRALGRASARAGAGLAPDGSPAARTPAESRVPSATHKSGRQEGGDVATPVT